MKCILCIFTQICGPNKGIDKRKVFSHLKIGSSEYTVFFFPHPESGHHLKRDIVKVEGQELLTGVINGPEKLLYEKSL